MAVETELWTPLPLDTIRLYRCLRSERDTGEGLHDECREIIDRNRHVLFQPGLKEVEVDHMVHEGTHWDGDLSNYPSRYLELYQGRLGHIIVSCTYTLGSRRAFDEVTFHRYSYDEFDRSKNWWVAAKTGLLRVRIERVVKVVSLKS